MVKGWDMQRCLEEILAVIVVYRCDLADADSIVSLSRSLKKSDCKLDLMVYDNSPLPQDVSLSIADISRITYHHDPSNPGVAKAYNAGARIAHEAGKKWLLLLDQDTEFPVDAIEKYAAAVATNAEIIMFAPRLASKGRLCSPCGYRGGMGYHISHRESGLMSLKGRAVLNSGMLVSLEAFDAISGFDERIPLDFADHDFCRRFAERYGKAFILDIDCEHGFSDMEDSSMESALARFDFFCRGALCSVRSLSDRLTHTVVVLIRCVVLSLRYRSWRFLPVMILSVTNVPRRNKL
jgi:glycosyltransferase involved in cell wall biosynthesis